jgi:hypothetical protein
MHCCRGAVYLNICRSLSCSRFSPAAAAPFISLPHASQLPHHHLAGHTADVSMAIGSPLSSDESTPCNTVFPCSFSYPVPITDCTASTLEADSEWGGHSLP